MDIRKGYMNKANYLMEAYEMDDDGDIAEESAKDAFSNLISSDEFIKMMGAYIIKNELAPDASSVGVITSYYKETILPEVESLIRTIGR